MIAGRSIQMSQLPWKQHCRDNVLQALLLSLWMLPDRCTAEAWRTTFTESQVWPFTPGPPVCPWYGALQLGSCSCPLPGCDFCLGLVDSHPRMVKTASMLFTLLGAWFVDRTYCFKLCSSFRKSLGLSVMTKKCLLLLVCLHLVLWLEFWLCSV